MTWWPWPWSLTYFSKTVTLVITCERWWETGLSYSTCVFLVTRPFTPYHNFWPNNLDLNFEWHSLNVAILIWLPRGELCCLLTTLVCVCNTAGYFCILNLTSKTLIQFVNHPYVLYLDVTGDILCRLGNTATFKVLFFCFLPCCLYYQRF